MDKMTKFGVITTLSYIAFIVCFRWSSFSQLKVIPLNEFGDFFAGVFGPLMLFWLILGYIQQQKELRQNTEALELQASELKKSVEQHKELVKTAKQQVEADLKSLELEQVKSRREAYPSFSISSAGLISKQGQKHTYSLQVLNSGQPATSVSFESIPKIKQIDGSKMVTYFETGKSHELRWDSEVSGDAPNNLKIVINCNDANTRGYTKLFELILDDEGQYHLSSISEVG